MKPIKHWPFVESPGEFTERLHRASQGPGGLLAGVRTVLIEQPPVISVEVLRPTLRTIVDLTHNYCFEDQSVCETERCDKIIDAAWAAES